MLARSAIEQRAGAVDVTLDQVAAESVGEGHRTFEVDRAADLESPKAGPVQRLPHHVRGERPIEQRHNSEAHPVDRDRCAMRRVTCDQRSAYGQPYRIGERLDSNHLAKLFHDSGEHFSPS